MEPTIKLNGTIYDLVTAQRDGVTAVYHSDGEYLRIGDRDKIREDLELHKKMESAGFPVAKLIAEGELEGKSYFTEASLGEHHLGKLFGEDVSESGSIGEVNFSSFLDVVKRFGRAQLTTKTNAKDFSKFADGIHLDILCKELPHHARKIEDQFNSIKSRLSALPFVITHGDFNPNNLYPAGVIDLEDSFYGPFGFDLVSALVHINYFPSEQIYEFFARYRFTSEQEQQYLALIDSIASEAQLPLLSDLKDDFEFCRAVWLVVRMHKWPKIQQFRYDLFVQKFLT